ncbi:DUF4357 domain-containing protein [Paenibacillus sp. S25]|uniref:DUF4357 domain-containing protein n=1 Tax=Paenibacillus sp. S25 TaxID=2823905 RepID=UPI001C65196A|nr:DUF4357 domain-containing protein [Paenibacillus sp. S25]QYK60759.1 hypothetical protein KAI37_01072 [Paenibacillus sp. S25]
MEYFLDQIKLILPVMNFRFLIPSTVRIIESQPLSRELQDEEKMKVYTLKNKNIFAKLIESQQGYVVLAGSQSNKTTSNSISDGWKKLRQKLLDSKVLKENGDFYIFTEDAIFSSISGASASVLGRQAAGPLEWIDDKGNTYKDNQKDKYGTKKNEWELTIKLSFRRWKIEILEELKLTQGTEISGFLSKYQELTQVDPEMSLKEEVKSILRDYRNFWDVHAELIQNAVDAINRRYRLINDPTYHLYNEFHQCFPEYSETSYIGKIEIRINTITKTLTILDNGVGIESENIVKFLLPKSSGKKIKQDYGFKGYGLTFVSFISRHLSVTSRKFTEIDAFEYEVSNIFDWISLEGMPLPNFPDQAIISEDPEMGEWNTKISLRFDDDYQRRFDAVAALDLVNNILNDSSDLERFCYILRTKTAIGNTKTLFSLPPIVPIDITLKVTFPNGTESGSINVPYSYYHPAQHPEIALNTFEFANYITQIQAANFTRGFRGLMHNIPDFTIGQRTPIKCNIYLSAISSTRLGNIEDQLRLNEIQDAGAKISCGIYLSIDGMPTGIKLDSWDKKGGAYKRYYVIVDCTLDISNTLDSGRKGITSYYADLIDSSVVNLINQTQIGESDSFASYASRDLDIGRGPTPGGGNGFNIPDFQLDINNAKEQHRVDDTRYSNEVTKIQKYSPLMSIPHSEQEVVALFYALLSQDIIKGYNVLYQAGSEKVYDACYTYNLPLLGNIEPVDPIGFGRLREQELRVRGYEEYNHAHLYAGQTIYPELCVEFKLSAGGLLNELNRQSNKAPNQIDLLVVWDTSVPPQISSTSYTLVPVNPTNRIFHGSTHRLGILGSRSSDIYVISLKDVLSFLP